MVEILVFAVYMHFRKCKMHISYPQIFWTILSFISFQNCCYTALELVEKEHQNIIKEVFLLKKTFLI